MEKYKIQINKVNKKVEESIIVKLLKKNKGYALNTEYISDKIKEDYANTYYKLSRLFENGKIKRGKFKQSFVFYIE